MHELHPDDPRWQLVQTVVHSPQFEKSNRLRSFLLFISERELTGQRDTISEQEIGVHVFGRPVGYNPGDDSIVRSQARILRQRLGEYFAGEPHSPLVVEIPKGNYVPVFRAAAVEPEPELAASEVAAMPVPPVVAAKPWWRRPSLWIALAAVVSAVLLFAWLRPGAKPRDSAEDSFWASIFGSRRQVVMVPADSSLVLEEEITGEDVSLDDYLSKRYLEHPKLHSNGDALSAMALGNSSYTSMADLNVVAHLLRAPQLHGAPVQIRYARDLSMSDAREENLILLGGTRANPWAQLFASRLNFAVMYDPKQDRNTVRNKAPAAGESAEYAQDHGPDHRVFGLVAYCDSLDGDGAALLVSGTSSAGTQAAGDFLLSDHGFRDFLRRIQHPDGSIPHFELLLAARERNGTAAESTILASRVEH